MESTPWCHASATKRLPHSTGNPAADRALEPALFTKPSVVIIDVAAGKLRPPVSSRWPGRRGRRQHIVCPVRPLLLVLAGGSALRCRRAELPPMTMPPPVLLAQRGNDGTSFQIGVKAPAGESQFESQGPGTAEGDECLGQRWRRSGPGDRSTRY